MKQHTSTRIYHAMFRSSAVEVDAFIREAEQKTGTRIAVSLTSSGRSRRVTWVHGTMEEVMLVIWGATECGKFTLRSIGT